MLTRRRLTQQRSSSMRCSKCGSRSVTLNCQGEICWLECSICGHIEKGEPVEGGTFSEQIDALHDEQPETI